MSNKKRSVICSDGRKFASITAAAEAFEVSPSCISQAISNQRPLRESNKTFVFTDSGGQESSGWNLAVEGFARKITAAIMSELRVLQARDDSCITETLSASLKHQCKLFTRTLRRAKTLKLRGDLCSD